MDGFTITANGGSRIRFRYDADAPETCAAFAQALPFSRSLFHARFSGAEIWTDDAPGLEVPQENATVFTQPGEVVIGPVTARRTKTAGCLGIYYGEGKGLDSCNVFAKVLEEDAHSLTALGASIWKEGAQLVHFEAWKE